MNTAVYSVYDYFLGEQADMAVVIPLENLQESLEQHLKEAVLNSPPPELAGASQQQTGYVRRNLHISSNSAMYLPR